MISQFDGIIGMDIDYEICSEVSVTTLPSGRIYHTPDGDFPSVTTILRDTENNVWIERWKQRVGEAEAERIRRQAADVGTRVHWYLERAWNGDDITADLRREQANVCRMVAGLLAVTRENITTVYGQETIVWDADAGYAGRLDLVGEWEGIPAIIEYKTTRRKKYGKDIEKYCVQASAYAFAHNILFGTEIDLIVTLVALADGQVQVIEEDASQYRSHMLDRIGQYRMLAEAI